MSIAAWIALPAALYWLYWIATQASVIGDAQAAFRGEITWTDFFRHGWGCCVCRTHWVTAVQAAGLAASGAGIVSTAVVWAGVNGAHARLCFWYETAVEGGDVGPPESAGDLA